VIDEEFLKLAPTCKGCGRIIGPWRPGGERSVTIVHRLTTWSDGLKRYGPAEQYHSACAPKRPNGEPYPPNLVILLEEGP